MSPAIASAVMFCDENHIVRAFRTRETICLSRVPKIIRLAQSRFC